MQGFEKTRIPFLGFLRTRYVYAYIYICILHVHMYPYLGYPIMETPTMHNCSPKASKQELAQPSQILKIEEHLGPHLCADQEKSARSPSSSLKASPTSILKPRRELRNKNDASGFKI